MQRTLLVVLVLVVTTLAVFWRTGANEFINYDDSDYVYENSHVKSGLNRDSVRWAFTTVSAANWHPLTWLSHMADCQLYGLNPKGHHLTSVALHVANAVLLFLVLMRMTGVLWNSAFVAFLFALHPLHVESVAWAAERKDVLSTFFFLLTLLAYHAYVMRHGLWRYVLVVVTFAMGLMSKPMLVSLPLILLFLDYWPLRRHLNSESGAGDVLAGADLPQKTPLLRLIVEKIPFFLLSVLSSIVTVYAQKAGEAVGNLQSFPVAVRLENALLAYAWYLEKTLAPYHLTLLYPFSAHMELWKVVGAALLLGGISLAVFWKKHTYPFFVTGWLWFLCTLIPVIGLVKVGSQARADRYTYIPLIGIFIMFSWGIAQVMRNRRYNRTVPACAAVAVLLAFSVLTWQQVARWKNSASLYTYTLSNTSENFVIHNNLGAAFEQEGRLDEAAVHFREAVRIKPSVADFHYNLGSLLKRQGKIDEAIVQFKEAIRRSPKKALVHYNLGLSLEESGNLAEAVNHLGEAVQIEPGNEMFHDGLGVVLEKQGRSDEAINHFKEALRIKPDNANAHYNYGISLANQGRLDEALGHFKESLRIKPDDAAVHTMMGAIFAEQGKFNESAGSYREALRLEPSFTDARIGLARVSRK